MAAGDFVVIAGSAAVTGNHRFITGTAEVDGTKRAFDIFPRGSIIDFQISGVDDAGAVEQHPNQDASGTADNGNIALKSSTVAVNTYNWSAHFTM
jgi:hypothetical protein